MPRIGDQLSHFSIGVYVQRKQTCRARILGTTFYLAQWQNRTEIRCHKRRWLQEVVKDRVVGGGL